MPTFLTRRHLFVLFAASVVLLAASDYLGWPPERTVYWYVARHLLALVAGACVSGVLFEWAARGAVIADFKRAFLHSSDLSRLFRDEQRQEWVRQILQAQIPADPTLSTAIYKDVVEPFMTDKRIRRRFAYNVRLLRQDTAWQLPALAASPDRYYGLNVDIDYEQSLPRGIQEVSVSLLIGSLYDDLQAAFDEVKCVYRDALPLHADDVANVRRQIQAAVDAKTADDLTDICVTLYIDQTSVPPSRVEFDERTGRLDFWFPIPAGDARPLRLRVVLDAPYLRDAGNYVIIFGEPTASPRVTFTLDREVGVASVVVLHFVQGGHRPVITPDTRHNALEVSFPHGPGAQWILPRSGLHFTWKAPAVQMAALTSGAALAGRTAQIDSAAPKPAAHGDRDRPSPREHVG